MYTLTELAALQVEHRIQLYRGLDSSHDLPILNSIPELIKSSLFVTVTSD